MNLQKINPQSSYQSLFGETEAAAPAVAESFSESILINELNQYVFGENNYLNTPFLEQRKKIKELIFRLFEIKPMAEEFIPFLAWVIIKFGQSPLSQKISTLISAENAVEYSERYYRMVVKEGSFLKGKDGVDVARLKLAAENQVFDCFYELRSRIREILELKNTGLKIDEEIKGLEKKIRDMNQQIKSMHSKDFQVDGMNSNTSRFGTYEEIKRKMDAIQDRIDNTPGLDEVTAKKWQAGIDLMQPDFDTYMENNHLEQTKSQMKNTVKTWGDEIRKKKERLKEIEEEADLPQLKIQREESLKKLVDKNVIEEAFVKYAEDKNESDPETSVDSEMISVGAAARLAEAMKSNFPSGFTMGGPSIDTNVAAGCAAPSVSKVENRPIKPDFDFSNRDKDKLIQLIYACDEKGIKFEKSAETLEALAYKTPSKAVKLLLDQNISDPSFFF